MSAELAGVVLAAGEGTRLRPLTGLRPKALCPVGDRPLVDHALDRIEPLVGTGPAEVAVNAHHFAGQVLAHCAARAHVSVEEGEALGTAGALGRWTGWLDGRAVLLTNADSYLPGGLASFRNGWDGKRSRLLCTPTTARPDFVTVDGTGVRYIGACLLPWALVRDLPATPSGLYEVLWRDADRDGELDLVVTGDLAVDCGTPADYLAANLHASGGANVVGEGATVLGRLERSVVWDGAWVGAGESLVDTVRAGDRANPVTVTVRSAP